VTGKRVGSSVISELGEAVASTAIDSTDGVAGIVGRFDSSLFGLSVSIGRRPARDLRRSDLVWKQKGRRMITIIAGPSFPSKREGTQYVLKPPLRHRILLGVCEE